VVKVLAKQKMGLGCLRGKIFFSSSQCRSPLGPASPLIRWIPGAVYRS